jgi:hypothetical protein
LQKRGFTSFTSKGEEEEEEAEDEDDLAGHVTELGCHHLRPATSVDAKTSNAS